MNRAIAFATRRGLSIEVVAVLDRATPETIRYVKQSPVIDPNTRFISTDFGDPGLARNAGIQAASGEYVSLFDGDDLVSENWLLAAYEVNRSDRQYVVHPEVNVYFDQRSALFYHADQMSEGFDHSNLILENYWTALCFTRRQTFLENPYAAMPPSSGFGYEDWHWNCEVMARGFIHTLASGTAHFIRDKATSSVKARHSAQNALIRHSALYDDFGKRFVRERGMVTNAAQGN
jgi:glycosyltransferase involved in cell wall biosynthesis